MIELNIPGRGAIELEHLVCDVNGTLAIDGQLLDGLARVIHGLRDRLQIHLLTANTHGRQSIIDHQLGLKATTIQPGSEAAQKAAYVRQLGAERVIAIGQGANDVEMLSCAAIGVCVLSAEGSATAALLASDIVCSSIFDALNLLENPLRLVATLRS